jgi:hypothetical protein
MSHNSPQNLLDVIAVQLKETPGGEMACSCNTVLQDAEAYVMWACGYFEQQVIDTSLMKRQCDTVGQTEISTLLDTWVQRHLL